ncbi:MAG: phosphoribosyltransferase family protein [Planctomycetota bacterium]
MSKSLNKNSVCVFCENKKTISQKIRRTRSRSSPFSYRPGSNRFVSLRQLHQDTLRLAGMIPPDVVAIVGVARSGIVPASMLSLLLHKPLFAIRQSLGDMVSVGNGWRLGASHVDVPQGRVAVVDDTVMTGNSLTQIAPVVRERFGKVVTAAVYVNPSAHVRPDIHAVELPWPHFLEWNVFNSVLSPNMAMDFDGILCRDCKHGEDDDGPNYQRFINTAEPLYTPRRVPIPLIVTARIERYRAVTIAWMAKHGIRCHKLVMHPAATLAERQGDDIAAFKARHFAEWAGRHHARPAPNAFIESEPKQAERIAKLSGRVTICPAAEKVFG